MTCCIIHALATLKQGAGAIQDSQPKVCLCRKLSCQVIYYFFATWSATYQKEPLFWNH
jgi:hypothetical protein